MQAAGILSVPAPSSWIPFSRCLLASSQGCPSFPRGLGTVLPSPAAPGEPQRAKANAYPALTPNFRRREILHQRFIYRKPGKVFGTHPSALEELLGMLPVTWYFWMEMSLSCASLSTPFCNSQMSRLALLFSLGPSGAVADTPYFISRTRIPHKLPPANQRERNLPRAQFPR